MAFNKIILVGNLTADPELKKTPNDVPYTSFCVAVSRRYAKPGDQTADFIEVIAWRQQAEIVAYNFAKGKPILVCGSLQIRPWTDAAGQKHSTAEVIADEVSFVGPKIPEQPEDDPQS